MHLGKPHHTGRKYRPDIDGLRAVAVLLVLAFHIGSRFNGGYIGVDVFFVISGYLISGAILTDLAADRFSILTFYERRIRRIVPALVAVLLVTSIFVYLLFLPDEMETYARSQLAALFSWSNFFFWSQSGYFAQPSITKPLLHTWSLAVEEQFYLFFPPLLMLLHRYAPRRIKITIGTLAIISFAAAVIVMLRNPTAAFFFAPLRAWELLIGAILCLRIFPSIQGFIARNIASITGLALILGPALLYTDDTAFPGLTALAPCAGAALIIAAGETGPSLIGAVLSWRPIVFVGLISYSLYLWHWPLLVFQRTNSIFISGSFETAKSKLLFFVIAFTLATLSWAFVEQPFRKGRYRPTRRALFLISGSAVAVLSCVSIGVLMLHGLPGRFPPDALKVAAFANYESKPIFRDGVCSIDGHDSFKQFRPDLCLSDHPREDSILLVGDSHAAQLYPGLIATLPQRQILQADVTGCRPLITQPAGKRSACGQFDAYLFHDYLEHHHIGTIILAGRWVPSDLPQLDTTIEFLRAHAPTVVLVGPSIEYDVSLPRILATAIRNGHPESTELHRSLEPQKLDATMASLAATRWHVPYVSYYQDLCIPNCPVFAAPGVPLLFDNNHVTREGSILMAQTMLAKGQLQ